MTSYQLILAVIVALTVINLATLAWVGWLQSKLHQRDQMVTATQRDVGQLKQEAQNVALAESLLQMEKAAGNDMKAAFAQVNSTFSKELQNTVARINQQLQNAASQLIDQEIAQYKDTLENLQTSAAAAMGQINDAIDQQKAGLTADLEKEIKRRQDDIMQKFDAKIADVVTSYLAESLGNDIDLGAQSQYLFRMLDEHKDELKKEILSEV